MKRRLVLVGAVAATAGLGTAWWAQRGRDAADPAVDALFGSRFERPDGGELALSELRGRPLVVNFWATWCPPCVRELPALDRFQQQQGPDGWRVVALALDGRAAVREFLARTPLSLSVGLLGPDGAELLRGLGNAQGGLPYTVMIDATGRVVWRHVGETDLPQLERESRRSRQQTL